ncbi:aspartyl/lysyl-trna synthetase [Holotrichia oblita]|uniref:Aspartyl/lysyl-trna synthetase n=1 Tax=Holotrichia oblita TaxID=644536 RepID=A0ACB9TDZ1_HOLOL|nr:aspartyl/lysyl-trna synthetase [Holotrichia oblita]
MSRWHNTRRGLRGWGDKPSRERAGLRTGRPTDLNSLLVVKAGLPPATRGNRMSNFKNTNTKTDGQLEVGEQATNKDDFEKRLEEALVFGRRSSLARTPPPTPPALTEQQDEEDQWQDEEVGGSPIYQLTQEEELEQVAKKRKRGHMSPTKEREARLASNREDMKEVNSSFAKVLKRTKELEKLVKESTKTKVEIKHMTRELAYLVNNLEKSINKYQAQHDCIKHKRHTKALEVGTQTETVGKSVGIQAERSDIELERQKVEAEIRNEFKMALDSDSGFAGLTKLLDQKWPEDKFERTRVVYAGGADLNTESDLALLIDPARVREDKAVYGLLKIHPDLGDVTEKSDGHLDYMVKTVATRTRNQETSERTTAIYILPLKIDVEGVNHMEIVYDMMKELRLNVHIHPTDKIRLFLGEGLNAEYVRKMTEFIFHGLGINFTLVTSSGTPKAPQNSVGKPAAGKVVVKCGSSTYADLLKTVKEKVDLRQVGVNIKAIKKTARGDLMLEVDGDVRKADTLKQAISKNIDNEVNIANKMVTIHVLDIDATTTKNGVEEVIRRAVNSELMTDLELQNLIHSLPYESILKVEGVVVSRPEGMTNPVQQTGEIEVQINKFDVLNKAAEDLPFHIRDYQKPKEPLRMQYRYLDLRFPEMQFNLRTRSWMLMKIREFLIYQANFVDVETPTLFNATPGGAQEYIVPTRFPGQFYSLVQSPQQFKQMLMAGAIDRYFQIARCYRDEGSRPDRQPEFTQLDIEMSFTSTGGIRKLVADMLQYSWPKYLDPLPNVFNEMTYEDAMEKYGSDKPDTRFDFELRNVTQILKPLNVLNQSNFYSTCIIIGSEMNYSSSIRKKLNTFSQESPDVKFLHSKIRSKADWMKNMGGILTDNVVHNLWNFCNLTEGCIVFLAFGPKPQTLSLMGKVRTAYANLLEETGINIRRNEMQMLWVTNFPLFELDEATGKLQTVHHPFTAPHPEDFHLLDDSPLTVRI